MAIIDELLLTIPDKFQHKATTSHRFKRDVFEFFDKPEFKDKICVEWGSNLGYTTRVLSYLFKEVTGFNKERAVEASELNKDRQNVRYYTQDIYNTELPIDTGDVFLVDADHSYDAVINDTLRSLNFNSAGKKYFIYDDYGALSDVKDAVDALILSDKIEIIKKIGYATDEVFTHKLRDYEGLICKEIS
jgi:AraC-like DNA-binding protein